MIVYVAYSDDEIGLPVAEADSIQSLARKIGLTESAIKKLLSGEHTTSKRNRIGVPLVIYKVEIDDGEGECMDDASPERILQDA